MKTKVKEDRATVEKVNNIVISPKDKNKLNTQIVISSLQQKAKPLFAKLKKITSIKTAAEFDEAARQAKLLKLLGKEAEKERDSIVKPMWKGVKEGVAKIDTHFKPFKMEIQNAVTNIDLLMSIYLQNAEKKQKQLDAKFESTTMKVSTYAKKASELQVTSTKAGAVIRRVWEAEVEDVKKVPREYMVPDMDKIVEACKQGKKIPGIKWEQKKKISI